RHGQVEQYQVQLRLPTQRLTERRDAGSLDHAQGGQPVTQCVQYRGPEQGVVVGNQDGGVFHGPSVAQSCFVVIRRKSGVTRTTQVLPRLPARRDASCNDAPATSSRSLR